MTHGQHTKATQLFGRIKDNRGETARHFGVEANLDTCLNLVFTFDQQIQELLRVYHSFTEIRHQANQGCVPFVYNLRVTVIIKCNKTF